MKKHCPICNTESARIFYNLDAVPVHSVRLLWSLDEALNFPTGNIALASCSECGFIWNTLFDEKLQNYSDEYESTQAFSPTFTTFSHRLAQQLVERYDLHHKEIIEIGCGQGEFLSLLCNLGDNHGIGFDPAFSSERSNVSNDRKFEIIPDYYSEKYNRINADFVCCKMTLEHIWDVANFIGSVRRAVGNRTDTTVFFQVPDVDRVLQEVAFWDIYYEHCSYFSPGSLAYLFRTQGFKINAIWRDYGEQYLMLDAQPFQGDSAPRAPQEDTIVDIKLRVEEFSSQVGLTQNDWSNTVKHAVQQNKKVVLWGSGSKAVAFLTTLNLCDDIEFTVDINPNKHGTYMARTGQKVVSPEFMEIYQPDLVILMNPLYHQEVQAELSRRGVSPRIIAVGK